jgi:hypothetical protein
MEDCLVEFDSSKIDEAGAGDGISSPGIEVGFIVFHPA